MNLLFNLIHMPRKPNPKFMEPKNLSSELEAVVGSGPLPRTEVVKKIWAYIKKNGLQDSSNKRMINCDSKLQAVFGKSQISMFEMNKLLSKHIS